MKHMISPNKLYLYMWRILNPHRFAKVPECGSTAQIQAGGIIVGQDPGKHRVLGQVIVASSWYIIFILYF